MSHYIFFLCCVLVFAYQSCESFSGRGGSGGFRGGGDGKGKTSGGSTSGNGTNNANGGISGGENSTGGNGTNNANGGISGGENSTAGNSTGGNPTIFTNGSELENACKSGTKRKEFTVTFPSSWDGPFPPGCNSNNPQGEELQKYIRGIGDYIQELNFQPSDGFTHLCKIDIRTDQTGLPAFRADDVIGFAVNNLIVHTFGINISKMESLLAKTNGLMTYERSKLINQSNMIGSSHGGYVAQGVTAESTFKLVQVGSTAELSGEPKLTIGSNFLFALGVGISNPKISLNIFVPANNNNTRDCKMRSLRFVATVEYMSK